MNNKHYSIETVKGYDPCSFRSNIIIVRERKMRAVRPGMSCTLYHEVFPLCSIFSLHSSKFTAVLHDIDHEENRRTQYLQIPKMISFSIGETVSYFVRHSTLDRPFSYASRSFLNKLCNLYT